MKKWLIWLMIVSANLAITTKEKLDAEIKFYKEKLELNNIKQYKPYPSSEYIEKRFQEEDSDKSRLQKMIDLLLGEESTTKAQKEQLSQYYSLADRKKGVFFGISLGGVSINNAYSDGRYSRLNNVQDTSGSSTCGNSDKTGCEMTGVFTPPNSSEWYNEDNGTYSDNFLNIDSSLFVFGGGFGYQTFFNPYFGSRIYGDGLISTGAEKIDGNNVGSLYYILGGMNADLLFDLPLNIFIKHNFWKNFTFGAHLGLNIGVMLLFDSASDGIRQYLKDGYTSQDVLWNRQLQVDYGFNLGFNITFAERNKLEFGARIPMSVLGLPSELRLGIERTANYTNASGNSTDLESNDIIFTRTPIYLVSYIHLF